MLRFYCDAMLGRLARDLRQLGLDTKYDRQKGGLAAYREARAEKRIFLTRDSRTRTLPGSFFVESQLPSEQIKQIKAKWGLPENRHAEPSGKNNLPNSQPGTLCRECNEQLRRISREQARPAIPFYIFQIHHEFYHCQKCGRIYWPGSHVEKIKARLAVSRPPDSSTDPRGAARPQSVRRFRPARRQTNTQTPRR